MTLRSKLQLKPDQAVVVLAQPDGLRLDLAISSGTPSAGDAVLAFVHDGVALGALESAICEAASADRLTWVAYPKAGRLGTDLNRDILREHFAKLAIRPVRQVALDDDWSALRLRPA